MVSNNIPQVKLGIIAVSRDCFPIALSTQRRENIVKEYKGEIFNCQTTVENEKDMLKALGEVKEQGCNALVVFLGNFGPETPETLIAKNFDGPCMFVAAAEGDAARNHRSHVHDGHDSHRYIQRYFCFVLLRSPCIRLSSQQMTSPSDVPASRNLE